MLSYSIELGNLLGCVTLSITLHYSLCCFFQDPEITHVEGEVDPVRDLDIINEELRMKDQEYFEKIFDEVERKYVRGNDKALKAEYEILTKFKKMLIEEKKHLQFGDWNQADIEVLLSTCQNII